MTAISAAELWDKLLRILEEKLQYGMVEQTRSVTSVNLEGAQLILTVNSNEALQFFQAETNQQRLIIMARPMIRLESIKVELL